MRVSPAWVNVTFAILLFLLCPAYMQTKSPVYLAITKYTGSGANILPQRGGVLQTLQQHGAGLGRQIERAADNSALRQAEGGIQRLTEVGTGIDRHFRQFF